VQEAGRRVLAFAGMVIGRFLSKVATGNTFFLNVIAHPMKAYLSKMQQL